MSVTRLPLLAARDLAAPLAWCAGQPVSAGRFLAQAQALAAQLPSQGLPVNLCQDRYRFALGLAAALLRGHTSLMPPNALPDTLRSLQDSAGPGSPPVYALTDDGPGPDGLDACGLQRVVVQPGALDGADAGEVPHIPADLEAVRLLTSGSTGTPQAHGKRWGALSTNIAAEAARLADHLGAASLAGLTVVATVPAQHSYGFESTVLLALLGGAAFDAGRPFYPADVADALARVPAPRALVTTPFHLKTLLLAGVPLPTTALTLSATAPLSPQLAAQAESALQGPLVEIYGCTEAGQVASRRTTQGEVWTTLGALRVTARGSGDDERFIVAGGHVLEPTPLADVLVLQDARHFHLLGRANDLIHVAGKRSSLAHLNFHLNRIAGVDDGAFWLPDEVDAGVVRPVAFVVAPTLTAAQVIAALRMHLEPVFVPRRVLHVAALPREATGKLTAAALRRFALQHLPAATTPAPAEGAAAPATGLPLCQADGSASASWPIAADHPAFAGHFPGRPLLPGVVLLSLVMETLAGAAALQALLGATPQVDNVKFLAAVGPGAVVRVALRPQGSGVAFDLQVGTQTVARGQLRPGSSAA
jgi:acyl-coenzyme A synthetase/AMP-(fatty) acid ligase/3-hydroxymyristoyl/3-hydroxydecanoyl-(acyl carrier protein) dehydratase